MDYDVIIIGAGISGLTTANYLHGHDLKVKVFEAEPEVGGRIRSIKKDGYILDRGFQVFLPSYPEARKLLDYEKLELQYFMNGAYILDNKNPFYVVDPIQNPKFIFQTLLGSGLTFKDKLKLLKLQNRVKAKSLEKIFDATDSAVSTRQKLKNQGYSFELIKNFFQPFLSGIFLEKELDTSSSMFEFVVKMFNEKGAAVPKKGISEISEQLLHNLPPIEVELSRRVKEVGSGYVVMDDGQRVESDHIVLAVEGNSDLYKQLGIKVNSEYVSVSNYYYSCSKAFVEEPILILNSDESSLINNLCFMSRISEDYAPEGRELVSLSVLDSKGISESDVKQELMNILGDEVSDWKYIHHFDIKYALPNQKSVKLSRTDKEIQVLKGIYLAGDFNLYGSLNAAMQSGREVADLILKEMSA